MYQLSKRWKDVDDERTEPGDRAIQALTWEYEREEPEEGSRIRDEPDVLLVLKEINGYYVRQPQPDGEKQGEQRVYSLRNAPHVPAFAALKGDGSTACGSWIYSGVFPEPGKNRAASRNGEGYTFLEWGYAWPANRRILYNRASADPDGRPWSERKRYIWWDEEQQKWTGYDVPDFPVNKAPDEPAKPDGTELDAHSGADPFIMMADGRGWLFVPSGLKDGPLPTHYQPEERPVGNGLYAHHTNPVPK